MRTGTAPAPTSDGAKLRKVCESAKKSGGKNASNKKDVYLRKQRIEKQIGFNSIFTDGFVIIRNKNLHLSEKFLTFAASQADC